MSDAPFSRTTFETSRVSDYFTVSGLRKQTGQERDRFVAVALKELMDNAIDGCETARIQPVITLERTISHAKGLVYLTVADNGPGIPPETVRRLLNFETRTSDKAVYRSPPVARRGMRSKHSWGCHTPLACGPRW